MNKKILVLGMTALVLAFMGLTLTGCNTQSKMVKGMTEEQYATLYLAGNKYKILFLDDQKMWQVSIVSPSTWGGGIYGSGDPNVASFEINTRKMPATVKIKPGEYPLTIRDESGLIKRNKVSEPYNFGAGKHYLVRLQTRPGIPLAEEVKAFISGDYVVTIVERNFRNPNALLDLSEEEVRAIFNRQTDK